MRISTIAELAAWAKRGQRADVARVEIHVTYTIFHNLTIENPTLWCFYNATFNPRREIGYFHLAIQASKVEFSMKMFWKKETKNIYQETRQRLDAKYLEKKMQILWGLALYFLITCIWTE